MENVLNRENVFAIVDQLRHVIDKSFSSSERLQLDMEAEMRRLRENATIYKQIISELEERLEHALRENRDLEKSVTELTKQLEYKDDFLATVEANTAELVLQLKETKKDCIITDYDKFEAKAQACESKADIHPSEPPPRKLTILTTKYEKTESDENEDTELEAPVTSYQTALQKAADSNDQLETDPMDEQQRQEKANLEQKLRNIEEQKKMLAYKLPSVQHLTQLWQEFNNFE
ncbi:hypothetical protein Ocin01_11569 [Orchesella cincta]|uniref:Uncharacterized protein n=1 Tax=Orchesella cincta TaxID=48709 RepID=A0A1D2MPU1_ORCCI|nr:hypothetical protein Ocin01_11569 [Orchesella cincta]